MKPVVVRLWLSCGVQAASRCRSQIKVLEHSGDTCGFAGVRDEQRYGGVSVHFIVLVVQKEEGSNVYGLTGALGCAMTDMEVSRLLARHEPKHIHYVH
jgi:hypothetical protein